MKKKKQKKKKEEKDYDDNSRYMHSIQSNRIESI